MGLNERRSSSVEERARNGRIFVCTEYVLVVNRISATISAEIRRKDGEPESSPRDAVLLCSLCMEMPASPTRQFRNDIEGSKYLVRF
jgi:hypothetical protein